MCHIPNLSPKMGGQYVPHSLLPVPKVEDCMCHIPSFLSQRWRTVCATFSSFFTKGWRTVCATFPPSFTKGWRTVCATFPPLSQEGRTVCATFPPLSPKEGITVVNTPLLSQRGNNSG